MRAEFAAALMHRPRVVLLDEPTLGLDFDAQQVIRDFVRSYESRTSAAVILTSHYLADIEALADDVVTLAGGLVTFRGTLAELRSRAGDRQRVRPVSSLVLCTLGSVYVQDVPKVALAVGLGAFAVVTGGGPASVAAAVATVVAVACSCCLMWAIGVLPNYKALSAVRADGFVIAGVQNVIRVPTPLYGPILHLVLTVAVAMPLGFLTTVPAQLLWNRELACYTGAMG